MSRREPLPAGADPEICGEADIGGALLEAANVIADMAQRVQLNGPEIVYASEKLGYALYKSAEALALCGAELEEALAETHRGYRHGRWLVEEAP